MSKSDHPGVWTHVYTHLRDAGADTFIPWDTFEGMTKRSYMASRSALARARQELEKMDGLTIGGQSAEGFWVWKNEA